ncbi:hypothetical protein EJ08DRAFT_524504 [Tothia fuscella]|uniref:Uncharacterized protein n=1 Tax=Tothia fuscella TaxID=1048955 RepID=A0A9P4NGY0_9PEZI|nr:hypothetical protein EJ08DRAFT_524504 [Tothia fuscella]
MPKVRQLLKRVQGSHPTRDQKALADFAIRLASDNSILRARAEGVEEALQIEQDRRKRGKAVWKANEIKDIEGKAQFYTPGRVTARINANKAAEEFKETKAFQKVQEKKDKQRQKEDQAILIAQKKSDREVAAKKKKQELQEAKEMKLASAQLKKDLQMATPSLKPKPIALKLKKKAVVVVESDIEYEELVTERIWSPRPRRTIKLPQYLKGDDLS